MLMLSGVLLAAVSTRGASLRLPAPQVSRPGPTSSRLTSRVKACASSLTSSEEDAAGPQPTYIRPAASLQPTSTPSPPQPLDQAPGSRAVAGGSRQVASSAAVASAAANLASCVFPLGDSDFRYGPPTSPGAHFRFASLEEVTPPLTPTLTLTQP